MKCHRRLGLLRLHGGKHHGHHGRHGHHGHHGRPECGPCHHGHRGFGPGFEAFGPCERGHRGRHSFGPERHGFGPDHDSFGPGRKGGKGHGHHGKWWKGHHGHKRHGPGKIGFEGFGQICDLEQRFDNVERAELLSIIEALAFRTPTPTAPQTSAPPAAEVADATPAQSSEQGK